MTPAFLKRLLGMRAFFVINLLILFFLSLNFGRTFLRNTSIQHEIDALQSQRAQLESKNTDLLSLAEQLQTKFYVEKEGRKKYGLQKEGEKLVIVTQQQTTPVGSDVEGTLEQAAERLQETSESIPNPRRWWWYFFNRAAFEQLIVYGQ